VLHSWFLFLQDDIEKLLVASSEGLKEGFGRKVQSTRCGSPSRWSSAPRRSWAWALEAPEAPWGHPPRGRSALRNQPGRDACPGPSGSDEVLLPYVAWPGDAEHGGQHPGHCRGRCSCGFRKKIFTMDLILKPKHISALYSVCRR